MVMTNTNCFSGNVRPMAVAGTFYTADGPRLKSEVEGYLAHASSQPSPGVVRALIVPHAGYVFSAPVAAEAYRRLPVHSSYKRVFLIGPSHHTWIDGASVATAWSAYQTPLGPVKADTALAKALVQSSSCFCFNRSAHDKEHCLEVQLPFLQTRMDTLPPIIPIIIGTQNYGTLQRIARILQPYFTPDNLFVISSDFSHYPSYADACRADSATGQALATGRLDLFLQALKQNAEAHIPNLATSACGQAAIAVLLMMSGQGQGLAMHHLAYRNSGDTPYGNHEQVVGYHAFTLEQAPRDTTNEEAGSKLLTERDKQSLKDIAWKSIRGESLGALAKTVAPNLRRQCGAFVTLTKQGRLRGCIGHFGEDVPLWQVVAAMAHDAAYGDPRFMPVTKEEWGDLHIEISVLTPLKRIHNIEEFHYGEEGIYIKKGNHAGTFLPQVADESGWDKEEFLGHCARDKAGLPWDGWKSAELYTYRAIIF